MLRRFAGLLAAVTLAGCGWMTSPRASSDAAVRLISPAVSTAVPVDAPLHFGFGGQMGSMTGMTVTMHIGSAAGATVPITMSWSADGKELTITPMSPLQHGTTYYVEFDCDGAMHPGMMSESGMGGMGGMMGMRGSQEMGFSLTTA